MNYANGNIDLPRKVKYIPRKKSTLPVIKESADRVGRAFNDFIKFIEDNPNLSIVEMDTSTAHEVAKYFSLLCLEAVH